MTEKEDSRREKLLKMATEILEKMDNHQIFGFIMTHAGKKAVPEILKAWGKRLTPGDKVEPKEDLVELVVD